MKPLALNNQGLSTPGMETFVSLAEDFTKTKSFSQYWRDLQSFSSFITLDKGKTSLVFTFFNLPARAELIFKVESFLLILAGAEDDSFIMTHFKVLALNVEFDFKIDLIVFGPETCSAPPSFSSGGRRVLQIEDSSVES
nr:hypothetical protein [Tanacetum cinerariifolium]